MLDAEPHSPLSYVARQEELLDAWWKKKLIWLTAHDPKVGYMRRDRKAVDTWWNLIRLAAEPSEAKRQDAQQGH